MWHSPGSVDFHRFWTDRATHARLRKNSKRRRPIVPDSGCIRPECYADDGDHRSGGFHRSRTVDWIGVDSAAIVV